MDDLDDYKSPPPRSTRELTIVDPEEITRLRAALAERDKVIVAMRNALQEAETYFDERADVNWEGDGPNAEMSLSTEIRQALALTPADLAGMRLVPVEPTEAMWSGLARDIVMWLTMHDGRTPRHLFTHLERIGRKIPQWLRDEPEMTHLDHAVSKGTIAVIIYRAMIGVLQHQTVRLIGDNHG